MKKAAALIALTFAFVSGIAFAHGGRTDKNGCHHDHKNGGYHCH